MLLTLHTCWMLGLRWGGVKFLHIERKMASVAHSQPPSHYMCKHAPGWLLVMVTTHRMQTKLNAFASMLTHCTDCAHAKDNFFAFPSYEIERSSFGRPWRSSGDPCAKDGKKTVAELLTKLQHLKIFHDPVNQTQVFFFEKRKTTISDSFERQIRACKLGSSNHNFSASKQSAACTLVLDCESVGQWFCSDGGFLFPQCGVQTRGFNIKVWSMSIAQDRFASCRKCPVGHIKMKSSVNLSPYACAHGFGDILGSYMCQFSTFWIEV